MNDEDVCEHETWLMWILKIDELSELMNYDMLLVIGYILKITWLRWCGKHGDMVMVMMML